MYDVIIIGAGPAGSMAAYKLAKNDYKVLLVEKMQVPREKSCSGILIERTIEFIKNEFGEIPDNVFCKPNITKGLILYDENNHPFKFESKGYNIWRSSFDHWLTLQAENQGAEFCPSTIALSCEQRDNHVAVHLQNDKTYEETAKIVIVCNGAGSSIKKALLKQSESNIITYQVFCKGTIDLDHNFFHAFLDPKFSEHDAWFNVKDDYLIVGVCVKDIHKLENYYKEFLSFLIAKYNLKIQSSDKKERWVIPLIQSGCPVYLGNGRIMFAGEAANFLNPMGEGISSALISSNAIADAIINTDIQQSPQITLDAYKKNISDEHARMVRQWSLLADISKRFIQYRD